MNLRSWITAGAKATDGSTPEALFIQVPVYMTQTENKSTIAICDTQPIAAEGIRTLLSGCDELQFMTTVDTLQSAYETTMVQSPDIFIIDKAFGVQPIIEWLGCLRDSQARTAAVVWGNSISEPEALRFFQLGARGIIRKTAGLVTLLNCLQAVRAGSTWMEDAVFREAVRPDRYPRSELTPREQQVMELVEQGLKNKEIGLELGIRPGTVKIHLKHIFEKTGVHGRYGLALSGLQNRGLIPMMTV
jgi:DNA-binding NarL/FixJ family response regulator